MEHADRGEAARRAERPRHRRGRRPAACRRSRPTSTPAKSMLQLAPETNGHVAVKAWAGAGQADRARPHASGAPPRRREDPLSRHPGAAAQDHQLADVERHRERDRLVQRRLHQRARADPVAHADRPPAVLHGSSVDDRLRRRLLQLPSAGGPEDHRRHPRHQAERQPRDRCSTSSRRTRSGASTRPTPTTC